MRLIAQERRNLRIAEGNDMTRNAKAGRYLTLDVISMKDKGDYERTCM